jgi:hypothetical protein
MRIEPVRTIAGLPSWRTSKLDWAARLDKLELDPGQEWRNNMHSMYLETIDDIEAELEEEETTFDESSKPFRLSDNRPRAPKTNSSSSGKTSPLTLEDIEYEREKKARKAKHWSNVVLRKEFPNALLSAEEAASSSSVHDEYCTEGLNMALDAVEEEEEEEEEEEDHNSEDTENNFHLDSAVEDEEEVWTDDSDTVVAPSDSGVSGTREETREEINKENVAEH